MTDTVRRGVVEFTEYQKKRLVETSLFFGIIYLFHEQDYCLSHRNNESLF